MEQMNHETTEKKVHVQLLRVTKMGERTMPERAGFETGNEIKLGGTTICPGIGIGRGRVVDREVAISRNQISPDHVESEQRRYSEALKMVTDSLHEHIEKAHSDSSLSASLILKNHEAILTDKQFHDAVRRRISAEYKNAMWAIEVEGKQIIGQLEASRNPYLKSRAEDVRDLVTSILDALTSTAETYQKILWQKTESEVLISGNLFPSEVMEARRFRSVAFATESRALSSHGAILLKGFGTPAVGGVRGLRESAVDGDQVIVD
jgi:phosphotransferase system enzyme I (PtsI)